MLNRRQMEIVMLLSETGRHYTGRKLGQKMNVSVRTIRSDMNEINHTLGKMSIVVNSDNETGYYFDASMRRKINEDRVVEKLSDQMNFDMPQTEHEMIVYLLFEFMYGSSFSIEDIADQLYLSESGAYGLLKKTDDLIRSKFSASLEKKENRWYLTAPESFLRSMISGIFTQRLNESLMIKYSHFICGDKSFRNQMRFMTLLALQFTRNHGIRLSGEGLYSYSVDILLSYERSSQGYALESMGEKPGVFGIELKELLVKEDSVFQVLTTDDMVYLERRLETKPRLVDAYQASDKVFDDILTAFEKDLYFYNLQLSDHKQEMAVSLQRLILNKQNNYYFNIMEKRQVQYMYPVFYYLAIQFAEEIKKKFPAVEFNHSDLSILTMMLKDNCTRKPIRAALIINSGKWFVQNALRRIKSRFSDRLVVTSVMNYWEYQAYGADADMIISTEPIGNTEKTVAQIDTMCTEESLQTIDQAVRHTNTQFDIVEIMTEDTELTDCLSSAYSSLQKRDLVNLRFSFPLTKKDLTRMLITDMENSLYICSPLAETDHSVKVTIHPKADVVYKEHKYSHISLFLFSYDTMDLLAANFKKTVS